MKTESLLNHLLPLAKRSFSNLSHDPDGRGERTIQEYSTELENDIADIRQWAQLNRQKLADALKLHSFMKLVNSAHRDFMKNPPSLEKSTLPETWKIKIRSFVPQYSWIKHPFAPYQFTNNNARIKMYEQRIKVLEEKNRIAVAIGKKEIPFADGIVILNYTEDRVQIRNNEKPSREIINTIKSNGFHWSPSNKVWQRKISEQAIYKASLLTGIEQEKFNN